MDLNKIIRFIQVFAVLLIFIGSLIGFPRNFAHGRNKKNSTSSFTITFYIR